MIDISETGRQIGEKLFVVLDTVQKRELIKYVLECDGQRNIPGTLAIMPIYEPQGHIEQTLTEIYEGDLYLCLEQRIVRVRGKEVELTAKEFDILALLASNPKRVFYL